MYHSTDMARNRVITSKYILATIIVAIVQTIVVVVMEAMVAYYFFSTVEDPFDSKNADKGIPIYLILFVLAQLFLLEMVWDTVKHRNSIQLIGFVVFDACIFSYSVFQYFQISNLQSDGADLNNERPSYDQFFEEMKDNMRPYLIVIPCIVGACLLTFGWLGFQLQRDFGWDVFKKIGASAGIRRMYRAYHIFVLLIKLDIYFFLGFAAQFIILVLLSSKVELWLTVAAVPVTLLVLVLAIFAVRYENKPVMILFMIGLLACMAYFIYRIVRIYDVSQADRYKNTEKFLTFFTVVSLLTTAVTFFQSIICYRNFDKGLKPHLAGQRDEKVDYDDYPPVRMTLDA
ncbi:hypothetical protein H4R35_001677 [Dimargaris xerosporica]|nr:hypothetical protein H4R35_001677 [Dimargaris xerosporica]